VRESGARFVIPSERLILSERSESKDLPMASRDLHLSSDER
jgi:hypothetical protein